MAKDVVANHAIYDCQFLSDKNSLDDNVRIEKLDSKKYVII